MSDQIFDCKQGVGTCVACGKNFECGAKKGPFDGDFTLEGWIHIPIKRGDDVSNQEVYHSSTKTVGYHEWVDIPNKLVYQSCCDCGLSHSIMVALPDPDAIPEETLRVRFLPEPELTEATREQDRLDIPLYREVKHLREERLKLRKALETLKSCFNGDGTRLLAINHIGFLWGTINMALGEADGDRSTGDKASD